MRERESTHKWEGATERGRQRIPGRLCVISTEPDAGLELKNCEIMTWAETKGWSLTDWGTQEPQLTSRFSGLINPLYMSDWMSTWLRKRHRHPCYKTQQNFLNKAYIKMKESRCTWVAQSVEQITLDFSSHHDPRVVGWSSVSSSTLSMESAWDSLSPSAPPLAHCVYL